MYPPFASLFHGKSTRRALHQYRIGSRFKFRSSLNSSNVDGETVVLHSEDYKFLLIYLHILKTDSHLLRDIMSSNDDLLPVGLNFNEISLASQRSRMIFRLGLILSFYRYRCCLTSAHNCDEHAQLVALLRGISYILQCCSTSSGFHKLA